MATNTQREFKKQMRQFEKEGKLPDGYFSRTKKITYTSGASVLFILFILWRTGVLGFIPMLFFSVFGGLQGAPAVEGPDYSDISATAEYIANELRGRPLDNRGKPGRGEVDSLAGAAPVKVKSVLDGRDMLRYDIIKEENYEYTGEEAAYDNVDLEAMAEGRLSLVLFAAFGTDGLLEDYTLYYTGEHVVYEWREGVRSEIYEY